MNTAECNSVLLTLKLAAMTMLVAASTTARGDILVHEGFNYTPVNNQAGGALGGKTGGVGWGGAWVDGTAGLPGEAFVYDTRGNPEDLYDGIYGGGLPDWDGATTNIPSTPNYSGCSDWSYSGANQSYTHSYRPLVQSADQLAGPDNILWLSMVVHFPRNTAATVPGIALTDGGYLLNRSESLYFSGLGTGDAIGIGHWTQWVAGDVNPLIYVDGVSSGTAGVDLSTTEDNIIVLKFEFGATDTVSAYAFKESDVLSESVFNANASSTATNGIDEATLDTFCFSMAYVENALDEIRIGDSFDDVIANIVSGSTDADASSVAAAPNAVPANGVTPATLTVTLRDQFYLPVTNQVVSLVGSTGNADVTAVNATTDAGGQAIFTVTSMDVETEIFTASNLTESVGITQTASVLFQGGTDADMSTVMRSTDAVIADGVSTATIIVTLKDALGDPKIGNGVTLTGTGNASISPSGAQMSDVNGQVTFTASNSVVETEIFTATETNDSVMITQTVMVDFVNPDPKGSLLVYEPFDYSVTNSETEGVIAGKSGGLGFSGPWVDGTVSSAGELFVYDSNGNTDTNQYDGTFGAGDPDWDGVVDNVPSVGNWAGLSDWSAINDFLNSYRPLAQTADEMAGSDNILWMSFVAHCGSVAADSVPGMVLTDGAYLTERSRSLSGGSEAIGIGNGTFNLWPVGDINPVVYEGGIADAENGPVLSLTEDNIIILKFVFASIDEVYAHAFTEAETLSEAQFDMHAVSASGAVDESALNTLSFAWRIHDNAIDEIRIGSTFIDVVKWTGPPQGMLLIVR